MLSTFALDRSSLSLLRIGFGSILLIDLLIRLPDVVVFYTDRGFFPSDYFISGGISPGTWSFLWRNDNPTLVYFHLGVQLFAALMLIIGYKTRLFLFVSWLLLLSLDNRNPILIHGGDKILRIMMFWSLFLPLADRWSVDSLLSKQREDKKDNNYIGIPSFAYIMQLCLIYWFAGLWKLNPLWLDKKEGVIEAFKQTFFTTPLAEYLLKFPSLLHLLDVATIVVEIGLPFLLFIPRTSIRLITVILFIILHVSFGTFLSLGIFPYICIITWLALLPGKDRFLSSPVDKQVGRDVVLTGLLSLVIFWNIATLEIPNYWHGFTVNQNIDRLLSVIHLDQKWQMFSRVFPHGKFKITATKNDRSKVIFDHSYYPSHRWRSYYYHLSATLKGEPHPEGEIMARYYCQNNQIDSVTIDLEAIEPPGHHVHTYDCEQIVKANLNSEARDKVS